MSKRPTNIRETPDTIALLPLSGTLLLPQTQRPLMIFEPRYIALIEQILISTRILGLIQPEDDSQESPKGNQVILKKVGSIGYLRAFEEQENGHYMVILDGLCRFDIIEETTSDKPFRTATIDTSAYASDFDPSKENDTVNREEFLTLLRSYSNFANFEFDWEGIKKIDTAQLVNMCCVMAPYGAVEKQALLEAKSLNHRAQTLIALAEMEMATANAPHPGAGLQ